jgi:dTDP-4-amino-4,6-dideoxygalactose transaminase
MAGVKSEKLIRLSKSCIGESEKAAVLGVLDREYLGMGAEVQQFEQALTNFFGRPAVCVVNGTAALHLALQACDVGPGDEVLVQSLTYVASFQAISATGAKPVACEVSPETLTLDWRDAEKRLTARTKAIMPVHYGGGVGSLDEIFAFAERNALRVVEDAAHAFGTSYRGRRIGGFGDVACFSFDGIKNITSGEGGCVVTDDPVVLQRLRDARLLGVEKDTENRYAGNRSWAFDVKAQGWRYHMSNIMAAIGIIQLERIKEISLHRQRLASLYTELLSASPSIRLLNQNFDEVVPHIYPLRVLGLRDRGGLQRALEASNIQTGHHYQPNHWLSFYQSDARMPLPQTDLVFRELLTLPLHMDLMEADVEYVSNVMKTLVSEYC